MCAVDECTRRAECRGWCDKHYRRWKKYGSPQGFSPHSTRRGEPLEFLQALPQTDDCIDWPYATDRKGYGKLQVDDSLRVATHIALELSGQPRPDLGGHHGACALHACDNPPCVNPRHLRWGTVEENNREMHEKGRYGSFDRSGVRNSATHLTEQDIRAIREMYVPRTFSYPKIASIYGVHPSTIAKIVQRKTFDEVQ